MSESSKSSLPSSDANPLATMNELFENDEGALTGGIDYDSLITVSLQNRVLDETEQMQSQNIVFYCRQCKSLQKTRKKEGKKLKFLCDACGSENIYYGSELGIKGFFKL